MPSLTIKKVPAQLLERLRAQAAAHRRSLNREVIVCLETAAQAAPVDAETLLAGARAARRQPARLHLTDRTLRALKTAGRP